MMVLKTLLQIPLSRVRLRGEQRGEGHQQSYRQQIHQLPALKGAVHRSELIGSQTHSLVLAAVLQNGSMRVRF